MREPKCFITLQKNVKVAHVYSDRYWLSNTHIFPVKSAKNLCNHANHMVM